MKKFLLIILCVFLSSSVISCTSGKSESGDTSIMSTVLDPMEYALYTNIFYEDQGNDYDDKEYTKEGTFTILYDSFNSVTRYYVWGYSDETHCCDWQWEFVPSDIDSLPAPGSKVSMTGTFVADDSALDGYWFVDTQIDVLREYTAFYGKYDTTTMSATLARVQLSNMANFAAEHNGEKVRVYGRAYGDGMIQHPYYDNSWYLDLEYSGEFPPIGTYIFVEGTFTGTDTSDIKIAVEKLIVE